MDAKLFCERSEPNKKFWQGVWGPPRRTEVLGYIVKNKKKKLYCAFIDFEKAFDKVWRDGLFHKLLQNNINGKMFSEIHNMYKNIKSCILYDNCTSEFFKCEMGVRPFPFPVSFPVKIFSEVFASMVIIEREGTWGNAMNSKVIDI